MLKPSELRVRPIFSVLLSLMAATACAGTQVSQVCQAPLAFLMTNESGFPIIATCANEQYAYRFWLGVAGSMPVENVFFTNTSHDSVGRCDFAALQGNSTPIKVSLTNLWNLDEAKKYCGSRSLKSDNGQLKYSTTYTGSIVIMPQKTSPVIDVTSYFANNHLNISTSPKS